MTARLVSEDLRRAQRNEHSVWANLCADLVAGGAITPADLASSVRANSTPGQRLLNAIRRWGNEKQLLGVAMAVAVAEKARGE